MLTCPPKPLAKADARDRYSETNVQRPTLNVQRRTDAKQWFLPDLKLGKRDAPYERHESGKNFAKE
jgi:hypothetical protein